MLQQPKQPSQNISLCKDLLPLARLHFQRGRGQLLTSDAVSGVISSTAPHIDVRRDGWHVLETLQWVDLEGGHAVLCADDGEQVVAEGVGHVLAPVGVWALARHVALHGEALRKQCSPH